jgi:hypothetical protein
LPSGVAQPLLISEWPFANFGMRCSLYTLSARFAAITADSQRSGRVCRFDAGSSAVAAACERIPLTTVCRLPAGGKGHYVTCHATASDSVIDLDRSALSSRLIHGLLCRVWSLMGVKNGRMLSRSDAPRLSSEIRPNCTIALMCECMDHGSHRDPRRTNHGPSGHGPAVVATLSQAKRSACKNDH